MHGCGNDFIILDCLQPVYTTQLSTHEIQRICNRHTGIGCDQIILITKEVIPNTHYKVDIYNQDGSHAYHCGNGLRCVARYIFDHISKQKKIILEIKNRKTLATSINNTNIQIDMGPVKILKQSIKITIKNPNQSKTYLFKVLDIGNKHAITTLTTPISEQDKNHLYLQLQQHKHNPEGINVGFMKIIDKNKIFLEVYERGSGKTLSCGSGACAAARVASKTENKVTVIQPGGNSHITQTKENIYLTGPTAYSFKGWYKKQPFKEKTNTAIKQQQLKYE